MQKTERTERQDVYTRITAQIVADLEKGVRPWVKPWNAEHAAGRITRPLRHNGQPYSGINILSLWMSATAQNFAAPIWMTFRQALELDAPSTQRRERLTYVLAAWRTCVSIVVVADLAARESGPPSIIASEWVPLGAGQRINSTV